MSETVATTRLGLRARALTLLAACGLSLAFARPASADPPVSAVDREAARAYATRGYELFEQGDFPRALEFFEQAEKRFHAPPHQLYIARATAKLGKLSDARALYQKLVDEKVDKDAPAAFKDAVATGKTELPEVEKRIPTLSVAVSGPRAEAAEVRLDGRPIGSADKPRSLDPGAHAIDVIAGEVRASRTVQLAEGARARVEVELKAPITTSVAPAIASFAVGVAGLGVGAVTGILALGKDPQEGPGALAPISIVGFVVGGLGVGGGVALLVLRPPPRTPEPEIRSSLAVRVGPGSVALLGSF